VKRGKPGGGVKERERVNWELGIESMGSIRHSSRRVMSGYRGDSSRKRQGRRKKREKGREEDEGRRKKKTHPMSLGGTPTTLDMTYFPRMGKPNF
jgi:hypothetical protein